MKQTQLLFLPLLLFIINISIAQTTAIPDETFEQALIDLNIDSDNTINGQVLTADISSIIELDLTDLFYFSAITDFTGIEDFTALEVINLKSVDVYLSEDQADTFNSNLNLREFRTYSSFDTNPFMYLPKLNFSNLVNLELISLINNNGDTVINLSNPNATFENLTIDLTHAYWDPGYNRFVCIEVNDPQAADANNYPYNTWDIITSPPDANGYTYVIYNFSSNCNLSTSSFNALKDIKMVPNPVKDKLNIENPQQISIDQVDVFDMTGKKVKSISSFDEAINLEGLEQGIYFVKVMSKNRTKTFKVMKK